MKKILTAILLLLCCWPCDGAKVYPLRAFYTKLPDGYAPLSAYQDSLFGRYADLVVELQGLGQLVFSRETSYLPVWTTSRGSWQLPEVIARHGDGNMQRPDILSRYSHVRLIENRAVRMVIHWRYFPDFSRVEWGDVVDEYFTIFADGRLQRSIRPGTSTIDEWTSGTGFISQAMALTASGIQIRSTEKTGGPDIDTNNRSNEHSDSGRTLTALKFKFDEEIRFPNDRVREALSGQNFKVLGPKVLQKEGVVGKALQFDGYYSGIRVEHFHVDEKKSLLVQAWVALGAYPFGWAPLVQQADWAKSGFYLGINEDGRPGFHISAGGKWVSASGPKPLELFRWYLLTGLYDADAGEVKLCLDGRRIASVPIGDAPVILSDRPLFVGINRQKMPHIAGRISRGKWPSLFGIDGLIDEVEVRNDYISTADIRNYVENFTGHTGLPDMAQRRMPVISEGEYAHSFSARYSRLQYYETWDNLWRVGDYADVVVSFEKLPIHLVFWRGTSYGPFWVTENGRWIGDQSNEDYRLLEYRGDAEGCLEHMSDKQCRHSHVRIIENTAARKVIHWRYGLVDSRYRFAPWNGGWGGWTDEYWTIYPDGVAVRHVARGIVFGDGWVETMFLSPPGTRPEDNVDLQAWSVIDGAGKRHDFSWEKNSPRGVVDDAMITMVNSKSRYRMYNIYPKESSVEIFAGHNKRSHFHWWNHWPVSQITSDGRGARAADRLAHSSLAWGAPGSDYLLYGLTDTNLEDLKMLALSWRQPPAIKNLKGANHMEYLPQERCWLIDGADSTVSFAMAASWDQPLVNPAFLLKDRDREPAAITINNRKLDQNDYRQGRAERNYGTDWIIWLAWQAVRDVIIKID